MCKWMILLLIIAVGLAGCGGALGAHDIAQPTPARVPTDASQSMGGPGAALAAAPNTTEGRRVRTIEDDPDADGIADYRVIITDSFDAAGNLVSTLREEDFEADGIIDSRVMTSFGG